MQIKRLLACIPLVAIACCSTPPEQPRQPPVTYTPIPRPAPTPEAPVVAVAPENWIDNPRTPGNWTYGAVGNATVATYAGEDGTVRLSIECDLAARQVRIARPGNAPSAVAMQVFTETENRQLSASPTTGSVPQLVAALSPRDPLLDAMAFSRGRFAIEIAGLAPLYLPSWIEVSRVVEDCR